MRIIALSLAIIAGLFAGHIITKAQANAVYAASPCGACR